MKLNNKGISIIEIVLTFSLIMVMVVGMLAIIFNYREKASISLEKLDMDTFKNTLTKDIQDDILKYGVVEMNNGGECKTNTELNSCVNIVFSNGQQKAFGTSKIDDSNEEKLKESIENKFLYYDGIKYKLTDNLPSTKSEKRGWTDFQTITVQDSNILSTDSMVLEDGTVFTLYSIDVYISHLDFDEDFGIHVVAYSEIKKDDNGMENDNRKYLRTEILSNNVVITDTPTLTDSSNNTSDASGLYKSTATNTGNPTYYFRGNVTNNYVNFAGYTWRIVRINEDGTVRIIKNGNAGGGYFFKGINKGSTNKDSMYYSNSSAKTSLDSWYAINILNNGYSDKVAIGDYFCEQAKVAPDSDSVTNSGVNMMIYSSYMPDFRCATDANGYGILNSNIGLITYDEVVHAGGYFGKNNDSTYLYGIGGFTMSPTGLYQTAPSLDEGVWYSDPWRIGNGSISTGSFTNSAPYAAVINLKGDVEVDGSGTSDDPYTVIVTTTSFKPKILADNEVITTTPTLKNSSNNTSDASGLYRSTATNDGNPTYYFRGNVTNNYVNFAGFTWRIVRINEDGTVRLIMQDGIDDNAFYKYNSLHNNYLYMYYMGVGIRSTLNQWFTTNITDKGFSDKTVSGRYYCEQAKVKSSSSYTSEKATMTLYSSYTPNFKCSNDGNGYGIVNSNIGLITYDEVVYAGGYFNKTNTDYYLYNANSFMTMSPGGLENGYALIWRVFGYTGANLSTGNGALSITSANGTNIVRPVINLKGYLTVTGTGTSTDPYVVN